MSEKKHGITIKRYSEDKYKDRADPTKEAGSFQVIKNYIPSPRKLTTRAGVTEYSFT